MFCVVGHHERGPCFPVHQLCFFWKRTVRFTGSFRVTLLEKLICRYVTLIGKLVFRKHTLLKELEAYWRNWFVVRLPYGEEL